MDFLKKHYEKILLGIVLVGLAVAFIFMPFKIAAEKQQLLDLETSLTHPKTKALTNSDLTFADATLKRMETPMAVDFGPPNRLVNPKAWLQTHDNPPRLYPSEKAGPNMVVVTNITPLYLSITLDEVRPADAADPASTPKYLISVEKQAAVRKDQQRKRPYLCKVGEKNENFQLKAVEGAGDNPTNIVLALSDGETINLNKEKPFRRIDGYMASLYYEPQKKKWTDQRVGQTLNINGEDYKIVAISKDEVVLSAPNGKKWTLKSTAPPS
jgi:hypothetical protein